MSVGEPGAVDKLDRSLLDQPYLGGFYCCKQFRALPLLSSLQVTSPLRHNFILLVLDERPNPLRIVMLDGENTPTRLFEGHRNAPREHGQEFFSCWLEYSWAIFEMLKLEEHTPVTLYWFKSRIVAP